MDIQTILAIAEKHNNPDAEIQYKSKFPPTTGQWVDESSYESITYERMIDSASSGYEYRIKPKTITLNGEELPRPVKNTRGLPVYSDSTLSTIIRLDLYSFESKEDAEKWVSALNKLFNS